MSATPTPVPDTRALWRKHLTNANVVAGSLQQPLLSEAEHILIAIGSQIVYIDGLVHSQWRTFLSPYGDYMCKRETLG